MGRTPPGETRGKVFGFVRDRLAGGRPPTVREVMEAFGFRSPMTAREHLEGLVEAGLLEKDAGKARGYRLAGERGVGTRFVPLLGRVPAGPLDAAVEDLEGYVAIHGGRPDAELFALRVRGDSMSGIGILDGDIVVVRRQEKAQTGEVVVALVGDEATVKRLHVRRNRVELRPENPRFEPIVPDPRELKILGKVIEVRRYMEKR